MFKTLLSRRSEEPFFLITVLLLIIIAVYNWVIALLALILIGGAYVLTRKNHNERNREISQFFDAISKSVDQASTYAVQNLPIGIAIIDMQSNLCWANSVFRDWVGDIDNDQQLDHIMPNLKVDKFWGKSGYFFEHIGERYYRVVYKYLQTEAADDDNYLILYFEDITDTERQKLNSLAAVPVFCDIEIDNLEEVAKGMTAVQRATLVTNVNNCLIGELSGHNCFIWAYGNEKYIACMSRDTLEYYKEDNFSFLEKIRSIHTVNRIPVTLSMGIALFPSDVIAAGKANFNELATKARAGLDLALGRGGDQVVVYEEDGSPHFDGGDDTHSWGRCRDFNLMLRKGKCEGRMRGETLAAGESKTVHGSEGMMLIYCGAGEVHVIVGDESVELKADEAARLDGYAGEIKLCSKEGAKLMLAKAKEI